MMLDYQLVDVDNHFYEPRDSFTRYIEPAFADRAVRPVVQPDGREMVVAADRVVTFLDRNIYDEVGRPGSLREMLHKMKTTASSASAPGAASRPPAPASRPTSSATTPPCAPSPAPTPPPWPNWKRIRRVN